LNSLTPKEEAFAVAVASGMNYSDAYRIAVKVRPTTKPETVNQEASKIMARPHVRTRVGELRKPIAEKAMITLESHMERLKELAQIALDNGQVAAAIKAEELRGKASGIYVEKKQITGSDGGPIQHAVKVKFGD
jgi:phage terminase small subunit